MSWLFGLVEAKITFQFQKMNSNPEIMFTNRILPAFNRFMITLRGMEVFWFN